ncbi:hypothetical protein D3C84_899340 [compost metagenome]
MGPGGVDDRVVVLVVQQFIGQVAGVVGREVDVHRQAELDRAGADGHQGADVAVGVVQFAFLDIARRVGGKHVVGLAELFRQQRGQVDGAVQALAIELAQAALRLFRMAQEHQGLGAIRRLGATFTGLQRQKQRAGRQQGGQDQISATFEVLGEFQRIDHGVNGSSAH